MEFDWVLFVVLAASHAGIYLVGRYDGRVAGIIDRTKTTQDRLDALRDHEFYEDSD
jgi:hypothetical protein